MFNGEYNSFTFDNTNWLATRGQAPLGFTNLLSVTGGNAHALRMDPSPGTPSYLRYSVVETNGATNIQLNLGSVAFWYRPHNWTSTNQGGSGPGEWSRFLEVGRDTNSSSWWSVFTDPGGGNIYFAAQTNTGPATYFLSAPIAFASNTWHYIALTYAGSQSSLFVDGTFLTNGSGVSVWPGPEATTNGFFVGSAGDGTATMHGDMDDLATFAYELSPVYIQGNFGVLGLPVYGVPLGAIDPSASADPIYGVNTSTFAAFGYGLNVISGPGNLIDLGPSGSCLTGGFPGITNLTALVLGTGTNTTTKVTFTIVGGTNGIMYDLYSTPMLVAPLTNSPWAWLGQCHTCETYQILEHLLHPTFYVLGSPRDSDGDGLTDAYEILVSKTDLNSFSTSGSAIPDGWLVFNGLNPNLMGIGNTDLDADGLNNQQEYFWGTNPQVSEGFAVFVANPAGFSGIP